MPINTDLYPILERALTFKDTWTINSEFKNSFSMNEIQGVYTQRAYFNRFNKSRKPLTANNIKANPINFYNMRYANPLGGGGSVYGKVFQLLSNGQSGHYLSTYVAKVMVDYGDAPETKHIFSTEVTVGNNQRLKTNNVGPRILAHLVASAKTKTGNQVYRYYIYIMDDFRHGKQSRTSMLLADYLENTGGCPTPTSPLVTKLKSTLLNFYSITKGYHGDLHTKNIAVVLEGKKLLHVFIFDYGAHQPFRQPFKCDSVKNAFAEIQKQFDINLFQSTNKNNTAFAPVIFNTPGQPYRSNGQVMRYNKMLYKTLIQSPKSTLYRNNSINSNNIQR